MMRFTWMLLLAAVVAGCRDDSRDLQPVVSTPLAFDPTEEIELAQWWSNDTELLWLQPSGAYVLFNGQSPYAAPVERGRWGQKSYRILWFTEYEEHATGPRQVRLMKTDEGDLAIIVNDLEPLVARETRPVVTEDRLLGVWTGGTGSLRLTGELRYRFDAMAEAAAPAVIAGHNGAWRVLEDAIVLIPDSPSVDSLRLEIERTDGEITILQTSRGPLRRPSHAAAD